MAEKPRTPSIAISLLPVVTLVIMLAVAIYIFRGDSLGGASQIVLLIATSICSLIAVFHCKIKWEDRTVCNHPFIDRNPIGQLDG